MAGFTNMPAYIDTLKGDRFASVMLMDGTKIGNLSDIDTLAYDHTTKIVEAEIDGYRRWYRLVEKPSGL